jgi:hypothetical protein
MIEIVEKRRAEEFVEWSHEWVRGDGSGYSFRCREDGTHLPMEAAAQANLAACESGEAKYVYCGIREFRWAYTHPAVGRCVCGAEVVLDGFTCPCECGRDYNSAGQELAPRSQWGEETGESLADILNIP